MTMQTALYFVAGMMIIFAFSMAAFAFWLKKKEDSEFSVLHHLHNIRVTAKRYEQFASDSRIMMCIVAFQGGMAWQKGNVSMAATAIAMLLGMQLFLFYIRKKMLLAHR